MVVGPTVLEQSGPLNVYLQVKLKGPMLGLGQEYKGEAKAIGWLAQ